MIKPVRNRILIQRLPLPEKTEGGLIMLGREYPTLGKVLAIGRGSYRKKSGVFMFDLPEVGMGLLSVGDEVHFSREAIRRGQEIDKDIIILDSDQALLGIRQ